MCSWAILPLVRLFLQVLGGVFQCFPVLGGVGWVWSHRRRGCTCLDWWLSPGHPDSGTCWGKVSPAPPSPHTWPLVRTSHKTFHFPFFGLHFPRKEFSCNFTFSIVRMCQVWWESNCLILNYLIFISSSASFSQKSKSSWSGWAGGEQDFPQKERFFFWNKDIRHSLL